MTGARTGCPAFVEARGVREGRGDGHRDNRTFQLPVKRLVSVKFDCNIFNYFMVILTGQLSAGGDGSSET